MPLTHTSGLRPLPPLRGAITTPSSANQRYVRTNRVPRLVDAAMMLHVGLLTRVLHVRLTAREWAVTKSAENASRSLADVMRMSTLRGHNPAGMVKA